MTDPLLVLKKIPYAEKIIKATGLPVTIPATLKRDHTPTKPQSLQGSTFLVGSAGVSKNSLKVLEGMLQQAGATTQTSVEAEGKVNGICYDASSCSSPEELIDLYTFFHGNLGSLKTSSHVLIVGKDPEVAASVRQAAAQRALVGFCKSLAKELGRKGVTVNVLFCDESKTLGESGAAVKFLLSPRSAFISGQSLTATQAAVAFDAVGADLKGKVALVTGAAHGIGAAIAKTLARDGAKVYCLDRPSESDALQKLSGSIGGHAILADLSDARIVDTVVHALNGNSDKLDVLVNNAGITRDKTLLRMPLESWNQTIGVNLMAALQLTEQLAEIIMQPGGRVIFMASVNGIAGAVGQTNYAAAKAGLMGATKRLARDFASKKISVFALAPGFIETRMTAAMPVVMREVARRFNALNQAGLPEDVADAVCFLATPGSSSLTGNVMRVCGLNHVGA